MKTASNTFTVYILKRNVTAHMPVPIWLIWRLVIFPFFDRPSMNKSLAALKEVLERPAEL